MTKEMDVRRAAVRKMGVILIASFLLVGPTGTAHADCSENCNNAYNSALGSCDSAYFNGINTCWDQWDYCVWQRGFDDPYCNWMSYICEQQLQDAWNNCINQAYANWESCHASC